MEKENIENKNTIYSLIIVGMIFCMIFMIYNVFTATDTRYTVIEGKIINSYPILNDKGEIDYLVIVFDNGKTYKIKEEKDLDLTVNSKLIIELSRSYQRFWFWGGYEPIDDFYYIEQIIKVPQS